MFWRRATSLLKHIGPNDRTKDLIWNISRLWQSLLVQLSDDSKSAHVVVTRNKDTLDLKSGTVLVQEKPFTSQGIGEVNKQVGALERLLQLIEKVITDESAEKEAIESHIQKVESVSDKTSELKGWLERRDISLPSSCGKRRKQRSSNAVEWCSLLSEMISSLCWKSPCVEISCAGKQSMIELVSWSSPWAQLCNVLQDLETLLLRGIAESMFQICNCVKHVAIGRCKRLQSLDGTGQNYMCWKQAEGMMIWSIRAVILILAGVGSRKQR